MSPLSGARRGAALIPALWLAVLAASFSAYFALLIYSDLTRPEPLGLQYEIEDEGLVVLGITPGSPAERAALVPGDQIVSVGARPVRGRLDWLAVEMDFHAGEPVPLGVESPSGARRLATLVLGRTTLDFWFTTAGVTLIVARTAQLVALILALVVAFSRPIERPALVGAWLLASLAVYSVTWPYGLAAGWRTLPPLLGYLLWPAFASTLGIGALVVSFFGLYPRKHLRRPWQWLLVWLPVAAVSAPQAVFAWRVVYRPGEALPPDGRTLGAALTAVWVAAALGLGVHGYRNRTDLADRAADAPR